MTVTRYYCPYCGTERPLEDLGCCGEVHAVPVTYEEISLQYGRKWATEVCGPDQQLVHDLAEEIKARMDYMRGPRLETMPRRGDDYCERVVYYGLD